MKKNEGLLWRGCGLFCHQRPDRSFYIRGKQMPLCSRCLGVYLGLLLSPLLTLFFLLRLDFMWIFAFMLGAQVPMFIDGTGQLRGMWESNNPRRFVTGTISGMGAGCGLTWVLSGTGI